MRDGMRVGGGWRQGPNNGGVPSLAAAVALVALPFGLLAWRRWPSSAEPEPRARDRLGLGLRRPSGVGAAPPSGLRNLDEIRARFRRRARLAWVDREEIGRAPCRERA